MTGSEYRKVIELIGWSQQEAGRQLGLSRRTAWNYATRGPPEPVGRLLVAFLALCMRDPPDD